MTDRELMQQALDALEEINKLSIGESAICLPAEIDGALDALRERLAQPEQCRYPDCKCATENPCLKGLAQPEQEFTTHEEGKDGWSDWVCPDPQSYLMKCCDCGLVHEAQFGVVRYTDTAEKENCDMVDDPNLQAVFRMRRSEQWTPKDTAYRPGGLAQQEQEPVSGVVLDEHGSAALVNNGAEEWHCKKHNARRLYTAPPQGIYYTPPQRKPLTEKRIEELYSFWVVDRQDIVGFARAVERTVEGEA